MMLHTLVLFSASKYDNQKDQLAWTGFHFTFRTFAKTYLKSEGRFFSPLHFDCQTQFSWKVLITIVLFTNNHGFKQTRLDLSPQLSCD